MVEMARERAQARADKEIAPTLDMKDDFPKRFKVKDIDEEKRNENNARAKSSSSYSSSSKMAPKSGATFGSLSIEDLKSRMQETEASTGGGKKKLEQKLEDLNGIQPLRPLQFSAIAAFMAFLGWQLTVYMTGRLVLI